jgi:hypothetical protein
MTASALFVAIALVGTAHAVVGQQVRIALAPLLFHD